MQLRYKGRRAFAAYGGASEHRLLTGREEPDQHPIQAVSGLEEELERIPAPVEPISNLELEEILK